MGRILSYQQGLSVLLGLVSGLVFFDRGAINFLSPFIITELKLTNAELGMASSAVALTWAAASYLVGRRSDRAGRRKPYLIAATLAFSLCSMASGLAGGFLGLILTRLAMGAAEGPVVTLGPALVLGASAPSRRGLNLALSALAGFLIGGVLAPVVLVALAGHLGWRAAFFVTGLPGLLAALALARWVKETPDSSEAATRKKSRGLDVLRIRNMWLCMAVASLLVAGQSVILTFAPILLTGVRHLPPADMGTAMSALGLATAAGMFILPVLSDRLGRKPVLIGFASLAAVAVSALSWAGPAVPPALIMAAAGIGFVAPMLSIAIIPGESVGTHERGTALGLAIASAEIVGGFAAPPLAGLVADHLGQGSLPPIAAACTLAGALLAFALRETAPRWTGIPDLALVPALTPSE